MKYPNKAEFTPDDRRVSTMPAAATERQPPGLIRGIDGEGLYVQLHGGGPKWRPSEPDPATPYVHVDGIEFRLPRPMVTVRGCCGGTCKTRAE